MPANLENAAVATGLEKVSFPVIPKVIPTPKKGNAKECSNCCTTALISHASKLMLKILQARFQQYSNRELPDVQAGFRKGRGTRHQIANIHWIIEKAREFQKNIYFCFIDERVTGRKARILQTQKIACKCQTFLSLLSGRRKQTSDIFPSLYKFKKRFLLKYWVAVMTPGFT